MLSTNDIAGIIESTPILHGSTIGPSYQGTRNQCIKLMGPHGDFALRLMPPSRQYASSRQIEFSIWQASADLHIAPKLLKVAPDFSFCVSQWIDGTHESPDIEFLDYLHKFQAMELNELPRFEIHEALRSYLQQLNISPSAFDAAWRDDLIRMDNDQANWLLCHNDLTPQNILKIDNRYKLLDFEYAAFNHRYFDLASLAINAKSAFYKLSSAQLLAHYHQRKATTAEIAQYEGVRRLALWLGALWASAEEPSWLDRFLPELNRTLPIKQRHLVDQLLP